MNKNFKVLLPEFPNKKFNILDYGAKSELDFNNQKAFQNAIDACSLAGGGTVLVPNGYYYTGPIELKSNVCLYVEENALIQFSKSKEEYPLEWTDYEGQRHIRAISPIHAVGQTNIAITGKGTIDGSGHLWRAIKQMKLTEKEWKRCLAKSPYVRPGKEGDIWYPTKTALDGFELGEPDFNDPEALKKAQENYDYYRPVLVSFKKCDKVLIEGVTLQNSPAWNIHPWFCSNFTLKNAKVRNKYSAQNGDGIDIESCKNCEIVGSTFEVGDDGICIKSGKNKEARQIVGPCENIWIHDCKVFDAHGGFVVGSEMSRGVKNILVEDCTFVGTDIGVRFKSAMGRGGVVEDINIKNISMIDILEEACIFTMGYTLFNFDKKDEADVDGSCKEDIPEFKNITLSNIVCKGAKIGVKILGLEQLPIHHIHFENVNIVCDKTIDLKYCEHISFENTTIVGTNEKLNYKKEVLKA